MQPVRPQAAETAMKIEDQKSRNFLSDDGRTGILIELVNDEVVHITFARKGASGSVELTPVQLEQLAELIPSARAFIQSLTAKPKLG